jgi:hypothetical protein
LVKVTFDRCTGGRLTTLDDFDCTTENGRAVDGLTPLPVTCTLSLTSP